MISRPVERHKTIDPQTARIVALFEAGKDIAEIVRDLDPQATTGGRYQKKSAEVQAALRRAYRG